MIATCDLPPMAQHLVDSTPHTSHFYMLPKILKLNNPGRPIVSACCCPAENIEAYLDEAIAPLVGCLLTYIKDTNDALRIFDTFLFDASNENPRFLLNAFFIQWRILLSDWWHGYGEQDGSQLCLFVHGLY